MFGVSICIMSLILIFMQKWWTSWQAAVRLNILFLLCFLPLSPLLAQSPTLIDLRRELIDYRPQHFYLAKVSDGRANKDSIGIVHNGVFNRQNLADFRGGLEKCLHDYLRWTLPRDSSKLAVEMEIKHLIIGETLEFATERAHLEFVAVFYDLTAERNALYVAKLNVEERLGNDVTGSHERRIRTAILQALKDLDTHGPWVKSNLIRPLVTRDAVQNQSDRVDSLAIMRISTESAEIDTGNFSSINTPFSVKPDETEAFGLGFMLLGSRQLAMNSTGWNGTAYIFFEQNPNAWQFPFSLGIERLLISDAVAIKNGWIPVEMNYRLLGMAAFRKLADWVHLGLFLQVPIGEEQVVSMSTFQTVERGFIGVSGGMGVYFMSNRSAGLVGGLRLHLLNTNSVSYPRDVGLRLEAGFRF